MYLVVQSCGLSTNLESLVKRYKEGNMSEKVKTGSVNRRIQRFSVKQMRA